MHLHTHTSHPLHNAQDLGVATSRPACYTNSSTWQLTNDLLSIVRQSWRQKHRQPMARFPIPPELVIMIFESLPAESAVCLAVTCRSLYHLLVPRLPNLQGAAKEAFLLRVEKDVPGVYFCDVCVRLHRWKSWRIHWKRWQCRRDNFLGECWNNHRYLSTSPERYPLPYPFARLVMNRHLYGAAHGIPTRRLSQYRLFESSIYSVDFDSTWIAAIIDNELFTRASYKLANTGCETKLREYIDCSEIKICSHLRLADPFVEPSSGWERIPELEPGIRGEFEPCQNSGSGCTKCRTDYDISITRKCERKWVMSIVIFKQWGDCRSRFAPEWKLMAGAELTRAESRHYRASLVPGALRPRERWLRAEALDRAARKTRKACKAQAKGNTLGVEL